jgi:hypothetical protein
MQCWQDIAQFQQFLQCMLSQMGPYPVQGVTDGSDAKAGNIGEYIIMNATMAYAANPASTQQTISVGVLPPGDWDLTSFLSASTNVGGAGFYLSPAPAGMSNNMAGGQWQLASGSTESVAINGRAARGSFSVPSLLPFTIIIDQAFATGLPAGTATFTVEARRMR